MRPLRRVGGGMNPASSFSARGSRIANSDEAGSAGRFTPAVFTPSLVLELPQRAAEAQFAFLEFFHHAGEVAGGAAGEMPSGPGRDDRDRDRGIFPAHDGARMRPEGAVISISPDSHSPASASAGQLMS
jgi:hypothetical protein